MSANIHTHSQTHRLIFRLGWYDSLQGHSHSSLGRNEQMQSQTKDEMIRKRKRKKERERESKKKEMYGCCTRCADSDACLLALLSSVQRNEIKVHVWERERREK